jgi:hypothetical protein
MSYKPPILGLDGVVMTCPGGSARGGGILSLASTSHVRSLEPGCYHPEWLNTRARFEKYLADRRGHWVDPYPDWDFEGVH